MRIAKWILPILGIGHCYGLESPLLISCLSRASTQLAMNQCADEELRRVDKELQDLTAQLLSSTDPRTAKQIRAAEKAWFAYLHAYLQARFPAKDKQLAYGSMYVMNYSLLEAALMERHILDLRHLLPR